MLPVSQAPRLHPEVSHPGLAPATSQDREDLGTLIAQGHPQMTLSHFGGGRGAALLALEHPD